MIRAVVAVVLAAALLGLLIAYGELDRCAPNATDRAGCGVPR